jgi:hypothetical protein
LNQFRIQNFLSEQCNGKLSPTDICRIRDALIVML